MSDTATDRLRQKSGFLSIAETAALGARGVTVFDPHSTLIARHAMLASGVVLWPGTVIEADAAGRVSLAAGVVLFGGARIVARGGEVAIGRDAEIGEDGGFTLRAVGPDVRVLVGDEARLKGGGVLELNTSIGRGAQVLGAIGVQNCRLGDGGSYRDAEPDRRGGVLKGVGVARGLSVPQGHVIQAFGVFAEAPLRRQSYFHPPAAPPPNAAG
jgi:carbonic anhydrase/acetyltransferase-like protein (isoleucine patch superfamily)